jgi:hypothetical protein
MTIAAKKRERRPATGCVASAPSALEIRALLEAGRLREAVLRASKFADLGEHRDRILSAREAYQRPEFQKQIGKDPMQLIADGVAALRERYVTGC